MGESSMTQRVLAFCCGLALLASSTAAPAADAAYDREMAARYTASAAAGDDRAQFYLGALYSLGVGVNQSDGEAFAWIARAAQQGHSQAMLVLAGMLAIGRGTQRDNVAAYKWAHIVSQGSRIPDLKNGASQLVSLLETRMSAAEIAQAKSDALAFRAVRMNAVAPGTVAPVIENMTSPVQTTALPTSATLSLPVAAGTPQPLPPANTREANVDRPTPKGGRDSDIDRLLDNVPSGLRKRYGF
jgi:hypothetical protein